MKKIAGFLSTLFFSMLLFAKPVNFFTPESPEIEIQPSVNINVIPDSKDSGLGISTIARFDMKELVWDAGINYVNKQFDLTTQVIYWPTFFDKINFGVGFTYHFYGYPSSFYENDIFADVYLRWRFTKYFELYTRYGFMGKYTLIPIIQDAEPVLKNGTMNFDLILTCYPAEKWNFYTQFSSATYFDYPVFMSIFLNNGVETVVYKDEITIGINLNTKWYDGIVVSLNVGQMSINIYGKIKL